MTRRLPPSPSVAEVDDVQALEEDVDTSPATNAIEARQPVAEPTAGRQGDDKEAPAGERLRRLRAARRWSLDDLNRESGVSVGYLSRIERGTALPDVEVLEGLRRAYGSEAQEVLDELEAAELVKSKGYDPVTAEVAVIAKRLDPERRAQLVDALHGILARTEQSEAADDVQPEPGEAVQR